MKTYVKPTLYYESFELTQFIAAGCTFLLGFNNEDCIMEAGMDPDAIADGVLSEIYCWTNGSENGLVQLFAS